jgi:hypothetical protein
MQWIQLWATLQLNVAVTLQQCLHDISHMLVSKVAQLLASIAADYITPQEDTKYQ